MSSDELPVVEVEVLVNVDSLRRGERGEVELTSRIQQLVHSGYMRILGHVQTAPAPAVVAAEPPAASVASPTRTRARKAVSDGTAGSDPA